VSNRGYCPSFFFFPLWKSLFISLWKREKPGLPLWKRGTKGDFKRRGA